MKGFINGNLNEIVEYCKQTLPENMNEVMKIADKVVDYTFMFQSKWELEKTYKPVIYKDKKVIWDNNPFGDPEWIYAMNRHRYFFILAQAYIFTGDEKYTTCFIDLLQQWIAYNPLTPEKMLTTWRTIEAGLRCENWIKAYEIFRESPVWNDELDKLFLEALEVHAEYIMGAHNDFKRQSNWGVIENHGLFLVGASFPSLKNSRQYVEVARRRLEKAMGRQVMADGCHWEQSQCYHNEVLRAFLDVAICAKNNGIELSEKFHESIQKMVYATLYMTRPNYLQLANGDSDEIDARDLLVRAAYLYKNKHFRAMGYENVDFESIWDIGMKGKIFYDSLEGELPEEVSKVLEEGGHYCLRSSWDEEAFYLHFKCGSLGGGHGHVDLLHIDLAYKGEDILIDKGRYTYVDSNERYYLKSAEGHNTCLVDHKPFTQIQDTWGYSKVAHPIQRKSVLDECFEYVEGAHLGYMDLEDSVFVNRKVLYIKPNIVVISDEFYAKEEHEYTQYFHFGKGKLSVEDRVMYTGKKVQMTMHHMEPLNKEKTRTISSKYYNHLQENDSLIINKKAKGSTSITTVMVLQEQGECKPVEVKGIPVSIENGQVIDKTVVEGIKICYDNKEYIMTIRHDEWVHGRQLVRVEDQYVYGRITLTIIEGNQVIQKSIF